MEEGNKEENFYPQFYKKLYQWYEKHLWVVRTVNVLYHLLPALAVLCYVDLLGLVYINGGRIMLLKVILVPLVTFTGVSVFRKFVNAKRPYTIYGTTPIVAKDKTGESMPSRHTASFAVIAMAWFYVNPTAGIIMLVLAFLMGVVSVLGGVHFVKDVVAGALIAVGFGVLCFWVI